MKSALVVLFFLTKLSTIGKAQLADSTVEKLMTKSSLSCTDIYYSTLKLIPELYYQGKTDTLNAVIDYTHRNCDIYTATIAYLMLRSIETHTFSEAIIDNCKYYKHVAEADNLSGKVYYEKNIIGLLNNYIIAAQRSAYDTLGCNDFSPVVSKEYLQFIQSLASSLLKRNDLNPVEQFLANTYAHPDATRFAGLKNDEFKGSLLQKAYNAYLGDEGVEYALSAGYWRPLGKLAVLADHPMLGGFVGSRENKFAVGLGFSVAFNRSPVMYSVEKNGSVFATNRFVQYYIGYDLAWALYSAKRTELTVNSGFGYDGINALAKNDEHGSRTIGSFNWNVGMGIKIFFKHSERSDGIYHSYVGIQAKYNIVNYCSSGGTDLTGQSACLVLTFGGFMVNRPIHFESLRQPFRFKCRG